MKTYHLPPEKFLEWCMVQLLMGHFRGGSRGSGSTPSVFVEATHSKWEYGGTEPKGGHKLSSVQQGGGVAWQPSYEGIVSDQVVYPTPTTINNVDFLVYIKQDRQKVDEAKVPTHLWSFFFKYPSFNTSV